MPTMLCSLIRRDRWSWDCVQNNPPPDARTSGFPDPGLIPTRPDFQSFSFIGQKVVQMFGMQGNVEFGHRFLQVENALFRQRPFSGRSRAFSISNQVGIYIYGLNRSLASIP